MSEWISTGGGYPNHLLRMEFPLVGAMPEIYRPETTILRISDEDQTHAYLWCYLERKAHGKRYLFNPLSLSVQRVKDMPGAIERLSTRFRFDNARAQSVGSDLGDLSRFLSWLDDPCHQGRYESILSDSDLALEALKKYHSQDKNLDRSPKSDPTD